MKILLLGDYSNVHATLAEGLRLLGHVVTVASDGDGWKNYPRDVDLRRGGSGFWGSVKYMLYLLRIFRQFKGYDVVHLINPVFLPLKAERIWPFYHYLRRNNKSVFLGAYGMDYYWVKAGLDCETFRYSDFNIGGVVRESRENAIWIRDSLNGPKGALNRYIASDCDGIVAGLYDVIMLVVGHDNVKPLWWLFLLPTLMVIAGIVILATDVKAIESMVVLVTGISLIAYAVNRFMEMWLLDAPKDKSASAESVN